MKQKKYFKSKKRNKMRIFYFDCYISEFIVYYSEERNSEFRDYNVPKYF